MLFYKALTILCWSHAITSFPLNANLRHKRDNLEGLGVGLHASGSSTAFSARLKAIELETSNATSLMTTSPVSSSAPTNFSSGAGASQASGTASNHTTQCAPPATSSQTSSSAFPLPSPITNTTIGAPQSGNTTTTLTDAQIAALAPPLGWQSGINPDGTGNCDGAVNGTNGKPILIPCQCPPDQVDFISNLTANVRAGHVVLNPTVHVTFPTDGSTVSQNARLNAAAVTVQNLNGAGIGCPISSTNFTAQSKSISAVSLG